MIRPAVVLRKNNRCNRSEKGAATQAVLMSVCQTLNRISLDHYSGRQSPVAAPRTTSLGPTVAVTLSVRCGLPGTRYWILHGPG